MKNLENFFYLFALTVSAALSAQGVANATEICNQIEDCEKMKQQIEQRLNALYKNRPPVLTGIIRESDGSVKLLTQADASDYCKSNGMRLPTIRELAMDAALHHGAAGIRETPQAGYTLIKVINQTANDDSRQDSVYNPAQLDRFYFNNSGYRTILRGSESDNMSIIWSSSVPINQDGSLAYRAANYLFDVNGILNGASGVRVSLEGAFRCVRRR